MTIALAMIFVFVVGWASTVFVIYLDGLNRSTFKYSMAGATVILALSLYALRATASDVTISGACVAFTAGLFIWGWQEVSFYMGFVTGPRKSACPHGCRGWKHFGHAIQTNLYHELVIVAFAIAIVALTWGRPNQIGTWTFLILWWMHQSAKLNMFLGVRNLHEEFLPEHLAYLKGFMTRRKMNLLFPFSVTISTVIAALLAQAALADDATRFEQVGYGLLTALMALAILEHWLLVLPMPTAAIWSFGLRSRIKPGAGGAKRLAAVTQGSREGLMARLVPSVHRRGDVLDFENIGMPLDHVISAEDLRNTLDRIGSGVVGRIERLKGVVRSDGAWMRFDIKEGRVSIAAHAPRRGEKAKVTIIGSGLDREALRSAFGDTGSRQWAAIA